MLQARFGATVRCVVHCALRKIGLAILVCTLPAYGASTTPQPRSPAEYRDHLKELAGLIAQCQQHIDASHCSSDAVGPDDIVTASEQTGPRLISYNWLRRPLQLIGDRKISPSDAKALLDDATQRIQLEQSEAPGASSSGPQQISRRAAERTALAAILTRAEFRHADRSLTRRVLEAIAIWINHVLAGLVAYSSRRRWLALLLEWGLVALACLGFAYWFVRQTRRARGLRLENTSQVENAPAMRSWQRLRQEADDAARQQRWRDAVRGYYWATIARFESRGQWSADRARTPREYLRLLVPGHARHDDLRLLTRRFESCWYGSDKATERDCDTARQLFERLAER
jgi:hypothetical protein